MRREYPAFQARHAEILAIAFDPLERAEAYARRHQLPFPLLVDRERRVYRAYGLARATWWDVLRPRVWLHYARLLLAGRRQTAPPGEDPFQLGGDFVVDPTGRLALVHPSKDPSDRPPVVALLAALEQPAAA